MYQLTFNFKKLGEATALACKMSTSGFRPRFETEANVPNVQAPKNSAGT